MKLKRQMIGHCDWNYFINQI